MSRRTLRIYYFIWHWFSRKIWRILVFFNYHLIWSSWGFRFLWHWMCWFINTPFFFFSKLFSVNTYPHFKRILRCWRPWNNFFYKPWTLIEFLLNKTILDLCLRLLNEILPGEDLLKTLFWRNIRLYFILIYFRQLFKYSPCYVFYPYLMTNKLLNTRSRPFPIKIS